MISCHISPEHDQLPHVSWAWSVATCLLNMISCHMSFEHDQLPHLPWAWSVATCLLSMISCHMSFERVLVLVTFVTQFALLTTLLLMHCWNVTAKWCDGDKSVTAFVTLSSGKVSSFDVSLKCGLLCKRFFARRTLERPQLKVNGLNMWLEADLQINFKNQLWCQL